MASSNSNLTQPRVNTTTMIDEERKDENAISANDDLYNPKGMPKIKRKKRKRSKSPKKDWTVPNLNHLKPYFEKL